MYSGIIPYFATLVNDADKKKSARRHQGILRFAHFSNRCSDLLATALQPKQHPTHEEEKPTRRLWDIVGGT